MLDHLGIQCTDMSASAAFYDAVLAPLGTRRLMDFGVAIGYGIPPKPDFWLGGLNSSEGFRESTSRSRHRIGPTCAPSRPRWTPAPRCCTNRANGVRPTAGGQAAAGTDLDYPLT